MIKRVAAVPGDPRPGTWLPAATQPQAAIVPPGQLVVLGDNAAWSQDSRQLGYFPGDRLLGIVVRRLALSRQFLRAAYRAQRGNTPAQKP